MPNRYHPKEYYNTHLRFDRVEVGEMFSYMNLEFCKVKPTSNTFANSKRDVDGRPVYFHPDMLVLVNEVEE